MSHHFDGICAKLPLVQYRLQLSPEVLQDLITMLDGRVLSPTDVRFIFIELIHKYWDANDRKTVEILTIQGYDLLKLLIGEEQQCFLREYASESLRLPVVSISAAV